MWLVRFGCFFVCGYVAGFDLVVLVVSSVSLVGVVVLTFWFARRLVFVV